LHQNAFGGRAPPTGGATALPHRAPSWILGVGAGKAGEEREEGKEREERKGGKRNEEGRDHPNKKAGYGPDMV